MARARNIKPGFFGNDTLAEIDPLGRLLFIGLWTVADREGRMEDRPKRIKAAVLPFDNCDLDALLDDLHRLGFIVRYQVEDGRFIQIINWHKHQNPHFKETPSVIPEWNQEFTKASDKPQASLSLAPNQPQHSRADSGFLIPDSGFQGSEQQQDATTVGQHEASGLPAAGPSLEPDPAPMEGEETPSSSENPQTPAAPAEAATAPAADPITVRSVSIAVLLRSRGVGVTAGDPRLRGWAERGITDAALLTALQTGEHRRSAAGNLNPVNAGLIDAILADVRGPLGTVPQARASPAVTRDQQRTSWTQQANPRIAAKHHGGTHGHTAAAHEFDNVVTLDAVARRLD